MNNSKVLFKITSIILVVTLFFSLQTNLVLADDQPTDPSATEEMLSDIGEPEQENTQAPEIMEPTGVEPSEEAATQPVATLEATDCIENCPDSEQNAEPVVDSTPTVQPTLQETAQVQPTTQETAQEQPTLEESVQETPTSEPDPEIEVSEIVAAAAEADVNLLLLDEDEEIVPMGSNEAVEILSGGDPYFQDASGNWIGYTSLTGTCAAIVTSCHQVATPIQAAIDAAPVNAYIYVEQDTYVENIVINKTLTLAGLWVGNENFADRPTLQGSVTITADEVHLNGWIIDATGKTNGIEVQGDTVMIANNEVMNASGSNIFVNGGNYDMIANNNIHDADTGNGILLVNATNIDIEENIINNNGNAAAGTAAGIYVSDTGSEGFWYNNIINNAIGIYNGTAAHDVNAQYNYFSGNTMDVSGGLVYTTVGYPEQSLPINFGFVPAPGSIPNENEIGSSTSSSPDPTDPTYIPVDGQPDLRCGMIWDASLEILKNGEFQRYVNDIWVSYDADQGGWVHDIGEEGNVQFLRKEDGSWYNLSEDGVVVALPDIDDSNWSILDGNWCTNRSGANLLFENCFLYYYENGSFQWALSTQDSKYYDYNVETASWLPRS